MRLFTGIDLPEAIKDRLDVLISHLRAHAHIKWNPAYNLHITTKFIGEWPEARLPELNEALKIVPAPAPFDIVVRGLGWFPNSHSPRVFWAGVETDPALVELARSTDRALAAIGIPSEERKYAPHLTLARIKEPVPLHGLRQAIAELSSVDFGAFTPACFYLYRSETGHAGSVYSKLQEYPLPTK